MAHYASPAAAKLRKSLSRQMQNCGRPGLIQRKF